MTCLMPKDPESTLREDLNKRRAFQAVKTLKQWQITSRKDFSTGCTNLLETQRYTQAVNQHHHLIDAIPILTSQFTATTATSISNTVSSSVTQTAICSQRITSNSIFPPTHCVGALPQPSSQHKAGLPWPPTILAAQSLAVASALALKRSHRFKELLQMTAEATGIAWDHLPELAHFSIALTAALARGRHRNDGAGVRRVGLWQICISSGKTQCASTSLKSDCTYTHIGHPDRSRKQP